MSTGINVTKPIKILDEGVLLTPDVSQINFTGGVTATTSGNNVTVNVPAAGITVGTTPSTGVDTRVFFQAGGVVQQDANFTFDNTLKRLTLKAVGTAATDIPFVVRNSADTANLMQVAGDNTMTFLALGNIGFSSSDLGGNVKIRRNFSSETMIELGGGDNAFISVKPINVPSYIAIGSSANGASINWDVTNYHFQIKNSFHNVFDVAGNPNSASATFRIGTIASNTNFFNVHGRNAGGTGLTTNPIFTINSSGTVGIGTEASTPGARLDVRAQGALSTDIAFRVRNSADTQNIVSFNGDGRFLIGQNASNACTGGTPQYAIAIGASAAVSGASETYGSPIAIGYDAQAVGTSAIAIGNSTRPNTGIAIGHGVQSRAEGVAIGGSTTNARGTVMGSGSSNSGYGGSSIGYDVDNTGDGSFLIGYFHSNTIASSFVWGSNGIKFWVNSNSNLVLANNKAITDANKATFVDTSATNCITMHNGTAPVANIADAYAQYSADITAGNAAPHFRTEVGDIIKLYKQSSAGITTVADLVTVLTNLGLLG